VQFQVNGADDGAPVTLDGQGRAVYDSTYFLDVGDKVTARYSGDALHDPSSAEVDPKIQPANTAITLTSSVNPQRPGEQVTLSAKVRSMSTAITPFGSVQFLIDGAPVLDWLELDDDGEVAIMGGGDLAPGEHVVQALYRDDTGAIADFTESRTSLTQRVESPWINQNPPSSPTFSPSPTSSPAAGSERRFSLVRATAGRAGVLTLLVSAPEAGKLTASAATRSGAKSSLALTTRDRTAAAVAGVVRAAKTTPYGTGKAPVSGPGQVRVVIRPNARARRALAAGSTLRVTASVTFRPTRNGPPRTVKTTITVKGKRR
jgi:hypothetical protein